MRQVSAAANRMARQLRTTVEIKVQKEQFTSIYVYYKSGEEEPVPIYCCSSENSDVKDICAKLRSMMYVLSFHPKYAYLKQIRSEIKQFS